MPFIAEKNSGSLVTPVTVTADDSVTCPVCNSAMTVRNAHYRENDVFVAKHFVHVDGNSDCSGESKQHLEMKAIAASKLQAEYPNAEVDIEVGIGDKQADVIVNFPTPDDPLGKGIAVEVQYKNTSKDREQTTRYYLANGYSVLWLEEYHFRGKDVDIDHIIPLWPAAIEHADYTENYPDVVTERKKEPVMMTVPLPKEGIRFTAVQHREIRWHWLLGRINAKRSEAEKQESTEGWNEVVTSSLGSYGEVALLETPDGGQVLQFRKSGSQFEDADIGVRLDKRTDLKQLVDFALEIDIRYTNAERADGFDE